MKQNTLGTILSFYRRKYNFLQVQVCDGICSIATLSRIEKGNNEIDSLVSESLIGRIGKEVTRFEIILNDEDYELWQMREDIKKIIEDGENKKAESLLEVYKNQTLDNHPVHKQFYLFYIAKIKMQSDYRKEELCNILIQALRITKPGFSLEKIKENLFNPTEIELILLLIDLEYQEWTTSDIEKTLVEMYKYVKKIYSGREKEKYAIKIMMNLLGQEKLLLDDKKIINYADEAINLLSQGRGVKSIAEIHFIKAKAIERYYRNTEKWKYQKKTCKKECYMAYVVFEVMNQKDKMNEITSFCEEKLEWQITK